ncbi:MAG: hypothetical protein PUP46_07290 [Endozoicomonas sp. (ex Botrylloides leachii)]|nr:hypothetical protein [Endozoicomonas sp. (ex Botrylloides leachii)]
MQARENNRQAYLDAMGIQVWFPRKVLPNAQPARPFDWFIEEQEHAPDSSLYSIPKSIDSDSPSPVAPIQPVRATDVLNHISSAQPVIAKSVPPSSIVAKAAATITSFRLVVIPLDQQHLVVADMPYTGLSQFTRYHHRLLQDLARAFQLPQPVFETAREFVWPLTSRAEGLLHQISQNDQAATDAVNAFLVNQYDLPQKKLVLLLGQAAAHFVFDPMRTFEELRGVHPEADTEQTVAITHGLNELMKIPSLKVDTWADLQALITT